MLPIWCHALTPITLGNLYLVDLHINYKKSITYPATILLQQELRELGRASFVLGYRFLSAEDPTICFATCQSKLVCFDRAKQKSVAVPDFLRQVMKEQE